jgi:DNA-directed RNA polymerase subunit RPC12/RpoP
MGSSKRCRTCGSRSLQPSRPTGPVETMFQAATATRYYECMGCGSRRRHPRGPDEPPQPGRDRLVYVALLIVLGGLLYLATRL